MDCAKWWNTRGQLGSYGVAALRRGFPRTHWFAQARSVFAVAAHRCEGVCNAPDAVTLWRLGDEVEERFEASWEIWTDNAEAWTEFFEAVAPAPSATLKEFLVKLNLIGEDQFEPLDRLRSSAGEGRGVAVSGGYAGTDEDVQMLAMGFDLGRHSELLVPYSIVAA